MGVQDHGEGETPPQGRVTHDDCIEKLPHKPLSSTFASVSQHGHRGGSVDKSCLV